MLKYRFFAIAITVLILLGSAGCSWSEETDTSSDGSFYTSAVGTETSSSTLSDGETQSYSTESGLSANTASTDTIVEQYLTDLQNVDKAGETVAAYVEDVPIYKKLVELSLAERAYTNARNLESIADQAEREAYLAQYGEDYRRRL